MPPFFVGFDLLKALQKVGVVIAEIRGRHGGATPIGFWCFWCLFLW